MPSLRKIHILLCAQTKGITIQSAADGIATRLVKQIITLKNGTD